MKAIIIGASLSGKTSIAKRLREKIDEPIVEMDEELTRMNGGKYPEELGYKNKVLAPMIVKSTLEKDSIIFLTNTDYFYIRDLQKAKKTGFKIILLDVELATLRKRNETRVKEEGYQDMHPYLGGMVKYIEKIKEGSLADEIIPGSKSVKETVKILQKLLEDYS